MIKWTLISLATAALALLALIGAANYQHSNEEVKLVTTDGHKRMICSVIKCWSYIDGDQTHQHNQVDDPIFSRR
jgi:hypothetical protein